MKNLRLAFLLCLSMVLLRANPVFADGIIIIDPPPEPPPHWEPWLTIRYHRVTVTIENQIATTKVDQVFRNDGPVMAEGEYVFPLPPGASVERFVMWVDGEPVEGEILTAEEARRIYESYVQRQRDPALLEYVGRDAVRARIFPIPSGAERRIQLEYAQVLPREEGMLHYRYPLDTERFSARPLENVSVHVTLKSDVNVQTIYSPSHQDVAVIDRQSAKQATISYEAQNVLPDRDFELYASSHAEDIGANLLSYQSNDEDGFFLLLLSPTVDRGDRPIIPRDVFLILDTSGSMDGEKLAQAKEALSYVLRHLNPKDRFNVVAFSSNTRSYAAAPQPAAKAEDAVAWVDTLEALGGTNIYLALSEALAQADAERPSVLIFLTDGLPTEGIVEEEMLLGALDAEAPAAARIFPFGLGYDVNTLLLDQLAQDHRGRTGYVEPHERIDERVSAFYAKIQSPVLTDVTLDFASVQTYDLYPAPLPDLYAGTQLIVAGRYAGEGPHTIQLRGNVEGESRRYTYEASFAQDGGSDFIPRLWATRKIGHLLTQIRLHGEREEWVDAVVTLSIRHGIITPYTSFLVEEPGEMLSTEGRERAEDELEEYLASPMPPSGEGAVEDAEMRQGLGGADSAPPPKAAEGNTSIRHIQDKTFFCTESLCTDATYVPDAMETHDLVFMTEAYWALTERYPELVTYFSVSEHAIVVAPDGLAYHFRIGAEADTVARPATQATATSAPTTQATATPPSTAAPTSTRLPRAPRDVPASSAAPCAGAIALAGFVVVVAARGRKRQLW